MSAAPSEPPVIRWVVRRGIRVPVTPKPRTAELLAERYGPSEWFTTPPSSEPTPETAAARIQAALDDFRTRADRRHPR